MPNALNRAERWHDLAEGYRPLAAFSPNAKSLFPDRRALHCAGEGR